MGPIKKSTIRRPSGAGWIDAILTVWYHLGDFMANGKGGSYFPSSRILCLGSFYFGHNAIAFFWGGILIVQRILITIALMICAVPLAMAQGIPDLDNSWVAWDQDDGFSPVLLNVPNGTGSPFTEARDLELGQLDATLTLYLRDGNNDSVVNYPREDMWLELGMGAEGDPIECPNGTIADANTEITP